VEAGLNGAHLGVHPARDNDCWLAPAVVLLSADHDVLAVVLDAALGHVSSSEIHTSAALDGVDVERADLDADGQRFPVLGVPKGGRIRAAQEELGEDGAS
jgi:hypothetical protein